MPICIKCNSSIKPASLAVTQAGENYHPTCLYCATCDRQLWGKPFKKNKEGRLICDQPCAPAPRPPSASKMRPPSAQKQPEPQIQQQTQQYQPNPYDQAPNQIPLSDYNYKSSYPIDLSMYKKPQADLNNNNYYQTQTQILMPQLNQQATFYPNNSQNKICKSCSQSVLNKRFITYENGDIICQECDNRFNIRPPRVNSAHMIVCSACNNTVRGQKYFTESNGRIVCDNCESHGPRCAKCEQLFAVNEPRRALPNRPEISFHMHCFDCVNCMSRIDTKDFYQNEHGLPMCLNCFEISKLPKCIKCFKHISGPYTLIDNKPIHKECFKCTNCNSDISADKGYFKNSLGQPICTSCNVKLNGAKCGKCNNVIEKDGLTFADKDYHQTCFKCDLCGTDLTKMKKTLTDKTNTALYCDPCFTKNFLPKCTKCNEPITTFSPGTKYEDKMYHKDCFACGRCKRTLADKKFFKSGNILICENCY